jgi:hypothetical protein
MAITLLKDEPGTNKFLTLSGMIDTKFVIYYTLYLKIEFYKTKLHI